MFTELLKRKQLKISTQVTCEYSIFILDYTIGTNNVSQQLKVALQMVKCDQPVIVQNYDLLVNAVSFNLIILKSFLCCFKF